MAQTNIIPMVNKNLFSDYYIKERLPQKLEEWREEEKIKESFRKITDLYNSKKELLSKYNEAQLEDNFIKPILKKALGHHFEVQETTYKKGKQPDYAFFPDEKTKEDAIKHKGEKDFYIKAISVGDAKKWDIPLDKKIKGGAAFEYQNPSFQIDTYLRETPPRWAILTNGRCWRIYYQETSYKLDSYYELDLVNIIERRDIEDFKYFYFFFRFEAFIEKADGKNFLDKVYEESVDYAKELGGGLQNNIYEALRILAEGFLNWKGNKLIKNKGTIKIIHDNSLVLLYRIIFILYSEDRGLLDITKDIYNKTYSLNSLKKEIADEYNKGKEFYPHLDVYWHKLNNLFTLINEGSKARGIPEKDFSIPSYNGGLFDPQKNRFLTEKSIGDYYLAKVVDLLARSNGGFVDYSTLDIRHLGSIYEGLLEYKLNIASEELVAIKEKGKEKWIQKKDADGKKICYEINEGGLYLTTDKGERKATGSYYTPEYIVKYIVKNTLGPVVEEKLKEVRKNNTKESDAILSIKVLDPAMGSGHFLVEAVDFLTTPLLEAVANDVEKGLLPEWEYSTEWAKREIVSHCMYGVDLNPLSVELAKLSLWLRTIAKDKPLSFLDHRIKCGNSLIGAKLSDLKYYPETKRKEKTESTLPAFVSQIFVDKLIGKIKELDMISDDKLDDIKKKEKIFEDFKELDAYKKTKAIADVYISIYFGNEVSPTSQKDSKNVYFDLIYSLEYPSNWEPKTKTDWFKNAQKIAEEKKFFHWELEFPEVFFEEGKIKENPGFDAVVGNPPYLRIQELQKADPSQVDYFNVAFASATGSYDIYVLFNEFGLQCLMRNGHLGMIQLSKFIQADFGKGIRKILPKYLDKIIDFRENQIFDVSTYTCLLFLSKIDQQEWSYFVTPALRNVDTEMPTLLNQKLDFSIISKNLTEAPWVLSNQDNLQILKKLNLFPEKLKDIVSNIFVGLQTSADHVYFLEEIEKIGADKIKVFSKSTNSEWILETIYLKQLLKGEDVHRYEPLEPKVWTIFPYDISGQNPRLLSSDEIKNNSPKLWEYLKTNEVELRDREYGRLKNNDEWWLYIYPKNLTLFNKKKIMTPDICKRGEISYDNVGYCHTTTVYSFVFKEECQENILFWNSILNSSLIWYFISNTGSILRGGFFRFKTNYLKPIPIRLISFITPKEEREKLLNELKEKYQNEKFDEALKMVEECLPKDKEGSFITDKEKSDVIHDFLAFLAEQMIEMNKQKQSEIRGFTNWLEGYCKVKIDELTSRTKLQAYYKYDWNEIKDVLVKNKKKIAGFDIIRREPLEKINDEYDTSIKKLSPLLQKIESTDKIIDQIVYRLYGLTEEEIKIVEER